MGGQIKGIDDALAQKVPTTVYSGKDAEGVISEITNESKKKNQSNGTTKKNNKILQPNGQYQIKNGEIHWLRETNNGTISIPLCNFDAKIISEETHDDGVESATHFTIEGKMRKGQTLPKISVPSERFASLNWVTANWGTKAIVYAGQNKKDHLRAAIQILSQGAPTTTVFTHLGWRYINKKWIYLHTGGAINESGNNKNVIVSPGHGRLINYVLPDPPEGAALKKAIEASLNFLEVAPFHVTFPLLAGAYRAPLGEIADIDFSIFLAGPSGNQKSELSAMIQAHYGATFKRLNLPANWTSTANTLERHSFLVKDAIFTVDDFAPTGTSADVARLHQQADRLFRAQGNKSGRGRMTAEITTRPENYPRGLIISTGEDVPRGTSLRARLLVLPIAPGDVDLDQLTTIQDNAAAGLLASSMSAYIRWIAPQFDELKEKLRSRLGELRSNASKLITKGHKRTPDMAASLAIAWELFLNFSEKSGAITRERQNELWHKGWSVLMDISGEQAAHQNSEDPVIKFLELINAAFLSGRAHAYTSDGKEPPNRERWGWRQDDSIWETRGGGDAEEIPLFKPKGDKIGWIEGDELWLQPGAAYAMAQRLAGDQKDNISIGQDTLWKRMRERKIILFNEKDHKNLIRRIAEGTRMYVLVISNKQILDGYPATPGTLGALETASPTPAPSVPISPINTTAPPTNIEMREERASILQYDGNFTREEADVQAGLFENVSSGREF